MADYKEIVVGQVVSEKGPLAGAEVTVYDKDMLIDDNLGTTVTDRDGRFEVTFTWADYKDGPFEERPDIYLKVKTAEGEKMKSEVIEVQEGKLSKDDVETFDLGIINVH